MHPFNIEYITEILKNARINKALSQRALSTKVGIPQSHLCNIEKGQVDLKVSSLLEISRALDLETMLVPRQLANTVRVLIEQTLSTEESKQPPPAYHLDEE